MVTLDLRIDAVTITSNDFATHPCAGVVLPMTDPSTYNDGGVDDPLYMSTNYKTTATTMNKTVEVYCHKMGAAAAAAGAGSSALAYLNVDPANNSATWSAGITAYKTSFSKLRFDEANQFVLRAVDNSTARSRSATSK